MSPAARRTLRLLLCSGVLLSLPPRSWGAEFRLLPALTLSEEYNDNILELPAGRSEYVTRVQPSLAVRLTGNRADLDLSSGLDYRHYARGLKDDEVNPTAGVNARIRSTDDFLNLDLGETYSRISLDVTRNKVAESLVVQQSDQNAVFVSPYLNWRPGEKSRLKTGYRFSDTRYWNSGTVDKEEHDAFVELTHEVTADLSASGGYNFAYTAADTGSYRRHDVYGGFKYLFKDGSTLFGRLGNSWQNFSNGASETHLFWDAGASRDFRIFTASVGTKMAYAEDPLTLSSRTTSYSATLSRAFRRGAVTLSGSYSEFETLQVAEPKQYKVEVLATGNYELRDGLVLRVSASGDHINRQQVTESQSLQRLSDYPYHLQASAALDYSMNRHTVLTVSYTHVSYRNEIDSATGASEIDRVIIETRFSL